MESQIEIVERLIEEGESFTFQNFCLAVGDYQGRYGGPDSPEWGIFKIRAQNIVSKHLSDNSPAMSLIAEGLTQYTEGNEPDKFEIAKSNLVKALKILATTLKNDVYGELKAEKSTPTSAALSNKIFVVHGHDQSLKTDIERFLHEIGLVPVVLHREADEGATVIEKFEKHSDVGFAFILLTPDEIGYTVDQINIPEPDKVIEYRARPNVIFEFGYFVGKLGRNRVCCLHKGDVVLPSDLNGLVYKKVDGSVDPQAYAIIRELKAAGYKISM
ncbi:TIR domain-containing protein [Psychromonas sp. SR45-3]|jgi:predicted nucleotide-binding protein|uniref:TIR domain-containing protein n=1 Tax=Psychromonas sp. SR45-3 TaxID=2760930 RepID=UPI0015FB4A36|nr:nucleotide-binding protein [Psychromonas sp. SR45-3]MBB1273197.1 nucleotide-binding protein [Psychromonas sp. SR45-3]